MADSAAMKDPHDRLREYAYVETKGLLAQVLLLERDLHGYGQIGPLPVDLGPPRDPRQQTVNVLARAQVDQVVLVEQRRSRPETMLICPMTTLKSCGNSSRLSLRRERAIGVTQDSGRSSR